jgi:hypothetical protein
MVIMAGESGVGPFLVCPVFCFAGLLLIFIELMKYGEIGRIRGRLLRWPRFQAGNMWRLLCKHSWYALRVGWRSRGHLANISSGTLR